MKPRQILFTGKMVRAILAGEKTETRRVVKPQPEMRNTIKGFSYFGIERLSDDGTFSDAYGKVYPCPYGLPGDRLWVRETWCPLDAPEHFHNPYQAKDMLYVGAMGHPHRNGCAYRASQDEGDSDAERCRQELGYKWRPSIHMPLWASRITLGIADVRVERVQSIDKAGSLVEGCKCYTCGHPDCEPQGHYGPRGAFMELWDSINSKRGYSWASNPWVWVISFQRIKPEYYSYLAGASTAGPGQTPTPRYKTPLRGRVPRQ